MKWATDASTVGNIGNWSRINPQLVQVYAAITPQLLHGFLSVKSARVVLFEREKSGKPSFMPTWYRWVEQTSALQTGGEPGGHLKHTPRCYTKDVEGFHDEKQFPERTKAAAWHTHCGQVDQPKAEAEIHAALA